MVTVLLTLIFIRPFISSLAFPRLNWAYSAILLGLLLLWMLRKKIPLESLKPATYPILFFIFALIISLGFSQNKISGLNELYKYIIASLLFFACASLNKEDKSRLILCLLLAGLLVSLLAIYQYFFVFRRLSVYAVKHEISDLFILDYIIRRRVFSPFVTPSTLGGYLIMLIPLAFIRKSTLWLLLPSSCALFLTQSLGSLLSIFTALALTFILRKKDRGKKFYLLALAALIVIVFFLRTQVQKEYFKPAISALMRINYWKETLGVIRQSGLFGVGPGNFNLIYSRYAHNSYLQIWAEMGILGILSFAWFSWKILRLSFKESPYLFAAIAAFLLHNFLDFTFFLPEVSWIWWALAGLALKDLTVSTEDGGQDENH